MIQNHQQKLGYISDKVFITKRMECSVLIFFSFYIMITAIVFNWFYQSKFDAANFDAYDILNDALEIDRIGPIDNESYYRYLLTFFVNSIECTSINYTVRMRPGLVFNSAFDRAFLVRRIRRDNVIQYFQCSIPQNTQKLNVRADFDNRHDNYSQTFSLVNNYSTFDPDSGKLIRKYISGVYLRFYSFKMGDDEIFGFSHDIKVDYSINLPTNYNVYIYCASDIIPFDIPALSQVMVMAISFVLFLIGCVSLLFFLWHCWSYKYVLIKKAIIESGLEFER